MHKILILILIIFLFSCYHKENKITIYTIKKGDHFAVQKYESLQTDEMSFYATFDSSAIYEIENKENQHDINKLMGFSDCNSHHHKNSARFGWRWLNNELEIHAYTYRNGERESEYITSITLNQENFYQLKLNDSHYHFFVNGIEIKMPRNSPCKIGLYYKLFPYFGGNETAPHDISIKIRHN